MARRTQKKVGIIGLGIIGSRIASVLRSKGWHVCVWNRTPKPEPSFLGSPAEVAAVCDVIQVFVADGAAFLEVLEGFGNSLTERHTVVCNATIGAEATLQAAQAVAATRAGFLDAPFTGSKAAAEKGALVYYVSGHEEVFKRAEPALLASSKAIVRAGNNFGDAATLKIATNMMVGVTVQVLAEAVALVSNAGIAPERFVEALEYHGVRSGITDMKIDGMLQGEFSPHFSVKHMLKDLKIGLKLAQSLELNLPTTSITAGRLGTLVNLGSHDLDYSALMKLYPSPQPQEQESPSPEPEPSPEVLPQPSTESLPKTEPTESKESEAKSAQTPAETDSQKPDPAPSVPSVPSVPSAPEQPKPTEISQTPEAKDNPAPAPKAPAPEPLEAEVVSQTSTPTPSPVSEEKPKPASKAPLAEKVRKWFSR